MHVTVYRRNYAAEKKAELEAKAAEAKTPKKRGRPRKQKRIEK